MYLIMEKFKHDAEAQGFYDSFNNFIFSKDRKVFNKLISKYQFLERVKDIPGDIMEFGVFKGSGMVGWLKANEIVSVNSKNVLGFDFFDHKGLLNDIKAEDQREMMRSLFEDRAFENSKDYDLLLDETLKAIGFENYKLIKGDVFKTVPSFLEKNPGFRASLINLDMDIDEPTYFVMNQLWDRLVPGGIMVFDEYGLPEWDESNAVDRFCAEKKIKLSTTGYVCPSAFLIKHL
jgi:hypothetical protein